MVEESKERKKAWEVVIGLTFAVAVILLLHFVSTQNWGKDRTGEERERKEIQEMLDKAKYNYQSPATD